MHLMLIYLIMYAILVYINSTFFLEIVQSFNMLSFNVSCFREDNQGLTDDYKRITEQYRELQKKFRWVYT